MAVLPAPAADMMGPDGEPCGSSPRGLLSRRPATSEYRIYIGKEADRLDERGLVADLEELVNEYRDPRDDGWEAVVRPRLASIAKDPGGTKALAGMARIRTQTLRTIVAERGAPRRAARDRLIEAAADWERRRAGAKQPPRGQGLGPTTRADLLTLSTAAPPERRCAGCGGPLGEKRADARYCGKGCKSRGERARKEAGGCRMDDLH